jgi:chromosome segregation ATPase
MNEKLDKIKERINEIKREKEELHEKHEYLVEQLKKTTDKNTSDIEFLKNELASMTGKSETKDEKLSSIRSFMISLEKSIASLESRQAAMRMKLEEDVKLANRELNLQLTERAKAISATLMAQSKDMIDKNQKDSKLVMENARKVMERNSEYDKRIASLANNINSLNKSLYELAGKNEALKNVINEKIGSIEKEMNGELIKVRDLENRLNKDVKDFEKFSSDQKTRMKEFETSVAGKLDMFAVKKENIKRDFDNLSVDLKNFAGRIDSLKEKNSYFDNRLKNAEVGIDNLKKWTDERITKMTDDQKVFNEGVVAKLNDASDKIIARLSHTEDKSTSEFIKQGDEIKVFRAHMTQFINDFVTNYEKRFDTMKKDIDTALAVIEQNAREQANQPRAMIFE